MATVAKDAEAKGQFEDAVMLNDLADVRIVLKLRQLYLQYQLLIKTERNFCNTLA